MTQSARVELREIIRANLEGRKTVKLPELVDRTVKHLLNEPGLRESVAVLLLRPGVYEEVRLVIGEGRGLILLGDEAVPREEVPARARKLLGRWSSWLEHAGDRHVRLTEMRRPDLLLAVAERRERAETETRIADVLEALAAALPDDETTVGQRFGAGHLDEIEAILRRVA